MEPEIETVSPDFCLELFLPPHASWSSKEIGKKVPYFSYILHLVGGTLYIVSDIEYAFKNNFLNKLIKEWMELNSSDLENISRCREMSMLSKEK